MGSDWSMDPILYLVERSSGIIDSTVGNYPKVVRDGLITDLVSAARRVSRTARNVSRLWPIERLPSWYIALSALRTSGRHCRLPENKNIYDNRAMATASSLREARQYTTGSVF